MFYLDKKEYHTTVKPIADYFKSSEYNYMLLDGSESNNRVMIGELWKYIYIRTKILHFNRISDQIT